MGHNCWWWCDPSHPQVLAEEEVGQGLSTALSKAEGFLLVCLFVEFWIRPARSLACIPEMSCHGVSLSTSAVCSARRIHLYHTCRVGRLGCHCWPTWLRFPLFTVDLHSHVPMSFHRIM